MINTSPQAVKSGQPFSQSPDYFEVIYGAKFCPEPRLTEPGGASGAALVAEAVVEQPEPPPPALPSIAEAQARVPGAALAGVARAGWSPQPGAGARFASAMARVDRERFPRTAPRLAPAQPALALQPRRDLPPDLGPAARIERMASVFEAAAEAQRELYRQHREIIRVFSDALAGLRVILGS